MESSVAEKHSQQQSHKCLIFHENCYNVQPFRQSIRVYMLQKAAEEKGDSS